MRKLIFWPNLIAICWDWNQNIHEHQNLLQSRLKQNWISSHLEAFWSGINKKFLLWLFKFRIEESSLKWEVNINFIAIPLSHLIKLFLQYYCNLNSSKILWNPLNSGPLQKSFLSLYPLLKKSLFPEYRIKQHFQIRHTFN